MNARLCESSNVLELQRYWEERDKFTPEQQLYGSEKSNGFLASQ
jgi:hypothetical protein